MIGKLQAQVAAGLSLIPIKPDGTKHPYGPWKKYQEQPASMQRVTSWWSKHPNHGVAVVCGTVSGRLEMIELEAAATRHMNALNTAAEARGIADLWHRVTHGWVHASPSGGLHWHIRIADDGAPMPGSMKIYARPTPSGRRVTLAETRGEGGYTIVPPSTGACHPSGRAWLTLAGRPGTIPVVTMQERNQVHALIREVLEKEAARGPFIDMETAAAATGVPYSTVHRWKQRGLLEPAGTQGRRILVDLQQVAALSRKRLTRAS
ncbi:bifunctional DNA primase/polymerase [Dermabacteraceae bacterium P13077]